MSIYQEIILHEYKHPRHFGTLSDPTAMCDVNNPLCGDAFTFYAVIEDSIFKDLSYTGQGCAISVASCSLLSDYVINKKVSEVKDMTGDDIIGLLGVELSPNRLKCALLPLEVIHKIIEQSINGKNNT